MKYYIDYQFLPKGAARPQDNGEAVGIEATDESGVVILPNVGDFISIDNSTDVEERTEFSGRVKSRLFSYARTAKEVHCSVNIVVEETDDDDWGKLIKE